MLVALNQTATVAGKARTGLMQSYLQAASAGAIGGPLVNLTGQVIGITVAGAGQGLAVARQIDGRARA